MFLAGSSARGLATGLGRAPAVATSLLRGPQAEAANRSLAVLPHRRTGAVGRGRADVPAREGAPAHQRRRPEPRQENSIPRFQPFGRAGGEGAKVAEHLFEEFGMSGRKEYCEKAAGERKSLLKWLEREIGMGARGIADMAEQEPRLAEQDKEAVSARVRWLTERLMLSDEQIRSLVHRRPSVLCRSVEDGMEPKVWSPLAPARLGVCGVVCRPLSVCPSA